MSIGRLRESLPSDQLSRHIYAITERISKSKILHQKALDDGLYLRKTVRQAIAYKVDPHMLDLQQ